MGENKLNIIFIITNEMHDDITDIYELIMDESFEEALDIIEKIRISLKDLKDNITKTED